MSDSGRVATGAGILKANPLLRQAEASLDRGQADEAARLVIEHLRKNPNDRRGIALLGKIAMKTGALVQAEQFLRRALALGADGLDVQRDLAATLYHQERLADALRAYTHLDQVASDPAITSLKAMTLDKLGRTEEALAVHRQLVETMAGDPRFWIAYGHGLRASGEVDEAIAAYRKATAIDSERGEAWWALASVKSAVLTDADIEEMSAALAIAIDVENLAPLHFALGRAWHDRGNHERAMSHYSEGNRLRRETINYDPTELSDEVTEFSREFGSDFFEATAPASDDGPVPVFVISLPRSGSTLLEQMLDQHPDIEAVGELPYIRALVRSALELHTRRGPIRVPELVKRMTDREARAFGEDYLNRASQHRRTDARFFVDKMPMNWSDIPFIRRILPNARFIGIRRDPLDCCFSNYIHYFSRAHASSFSLSHLGQSYVDYVRLMDHLDQAAPGLVQHVRYEQLVEDPEPTLRSILDYLGLEWDPALLRFHESTRVVRTPSSEQVRRPLNRRGMGTWRPYSKWLDPLRKALGPLVSSDSAPA